MTVQRQPGRRPADQSSALPVGGSKAGRDVPPLVAGDHLSRAEFERRYQAMPQVKKAELVEGVVYMPSPVSVQHGEPHAIVIGWLLTYVAATPAIRLLDNTSLRIDARSELQPDAMVLLDEARGGACRIERDGFVAGSPEFVVEVAASSVSYDMHSKLRVYQRNGVQEYLVLSTYEQHAIWHRLIGGKYARNQPGDDGVLRSQLFPGLWLDPQKLWSNDVSGLLAVLHEGLRSPEHAEFVARLNLPPSAG
jgi:Uma2 family endonuclease